MTVSAVRKDTEELSMAVDAEFQASPERVWQLWADARQLERWWGPPTYPATFTIHDLVSGGQAMYFMTGPEGDRHHGYWDILEAAPPRHLAFRDGFAREDGTPDPELPTMTARVHIEAIGDGRTRMTINSTFPDVEAMEKLLAMGMEQGLVEAIGQIDAILAEAVAPSGSEA